MKLIELLSHDQIYFINPALITQAVGKDDRANAYITIKLAETTQSGAAATLRFEGDDARRLFSELRKVGVQETM